MTCITPYAEDAEPHDILLCLQTGKKLADEDRMRYEGGQYYVQIRRGDANHFFHMHSRHWKIPIRLQTAVMWKLSLDVTKLPHFEVPEGYDSWTYLNKLCHEGLDKRVWSRMHEGT